MKRAVTLIAISVTLVSLLCACGGQPVSDSQASESPSAADVSASTGAYKDGTYQYTGKKDGEGYLVEGTMVISDGLIQSMEWQIVDDHRHRVFDETYEEVFGNDTYKQQCRDDLSGMKTYAPALIDKQEVGDVDAVSGATWSYGKFQEAAAALLEQAKP